MRYTKSLVLLAAVMVGVRVEGHAASANCQGALDDRTQFIADKIDASARELKQRGLLTSPRAWRAETAAYGLPGLDLPAEFGGGDLSTVRMASLFERAGRHALDLRDVVGAGHARLLRSSPDPTAREILSGVVQGKNYVAIAITEENAGSDLHAMTSHARPTKGGYLLNGAKLFNARLANATHVILFTQSPTAPGRLSSFVVPIDHPGLGIVDLEAHGLHGNSFGGLRFEDMFVPANLALGADAQGGALFREHFLYWRLMMAAAAVGTGQAALDQAADRMRTREVFGGAIGRFTHLQQQLAEHTAKLHMAHLLIRDAAQAMDKGHVDRATPLVAMAKAEGVEFALAAADFAMKTFGAEGYSSRVDIGQRVIDLMGLRIADGTTDVLRAEVVRKVYGREFWDLAVGTPAKPEGMAAGAPIMSGPFSVSAPRPPAAGDTMANLQRGAPHAFARQSDYNQLIRPGGGGACATVAAFNLLQILRAQNKLELLNPAAVIADAFLAQPDLLDGRVTDAQFSALLDHFARYLGPLRTRVEVDSISEDLSAVITPMAHQQQILVYQVHGPGNHYVGRHFVIVKRRDGLDVTVQDPTNPYVDYDYHMSTAVHDGHGVIRLRRVGQPTTAKYAYDLSRVVTITSY